MSTYVHCTDQLLSTRDSIDRTFFIHGQNLPRPHWLQYEPCVHSFFAAVEVGAASVSFPECFGALLEGQSVGRIQAICWQNTTIG